MNKYRTSSEGIIITGDHSRDRFIYLESTGNEPANLREAWIKISRFWTADLPGGAGCLIEYLKAIGTEAYDPWQGSEETAESLYLLTRQGERNRQKWRIGQYITAGESEYPCARLSQGLIETIPRSAPIVLMDFNQGWLKKNHGLLADFLKGRRYLVRTYDPRKPEWVEVRKHGSAAGIWFSPVQDMADGALWFPGNWEDMRERLLRYLQADDTIWNRGQWLHHVVIQIYYDGVLVVGPKMDEQGKLLIFAGDQPNSFSWLGYGAVLGGGIVFVASLIQALIDETDLLQIASEGLVRARTMVEEGYVGPHEENTTRRLEKTTNLPVSSLSEPKIEGIMTYDTDCLRADWSAACDIVCGEEQVLRRRTFKIGNLITFTPDYTRSLLRLAGRLENHIREERKILSFTIFGGPGSGKSFMAEQIAQVIDPAGKIFEQRPFNLSQFSDPVRLTDAFQEIQAISLHQGKIPFVLWDEFDAIYQGNRAGWLSYFLMPMQDAKFQNGLMEQNLGKCVFVFIGGTFKDEYDFREWALTTTEGKRLKGPDFHSRLDSSLTAASVEVILKPEEMLTAPDPARLARAVIIRSCLKKQERVRAITQDVLAYLLHISLVHGARSLQRIITASELRKTSVFQAFHLPPTDVLQLHVRESITNRADPVLDFLRKINGEWLSQEPPLELKWRDSARGPL